MSTFARINEFGFIETPYRKVEAGRVTEQIDYLTADREEHYLVAQANTPMDKDGNFTVEKDFHPLSAGISSKWSRRRSITWTFRPSSSCPWRRG